MVFPIALAVALALVAGAADVKSYTALLLHGNADAPISSDGVRGPVAHRAQSKTQPSQCSGMCPMLVEYCPPGTVWAKKRASDCCKDACVPLRLRRR